MSDVPPPDTGRSAPAPPDSALPDTSEADVAVPRLPAQRLRSTILIAVTIGLVLVVLAEGSARWLEPALPRGAGWPDDATATKVAQLDRLEAAGCTDVVFVGNSMTRDDLVPDRFTGADPADRSAYNASLDAASPELLRRWVIDEVLPATDPALVVVGVASFDLNDEASTPAAALRAWNAAPYTATGIDGRLEAAFTRQLALVRHRTSLRDPDTVLDAIDDRLSGVRADRPDASGIAGVIAADGHGLSRRDLAFDGHDATIARLRDQFLMPFELGGEQAGELRTLVTEVRDTGADVAVLVLPVTDAYVRAHPRGIEDVNAFHRLLDETLDGTGAVVIDTADTDQSDFADTHHLDGDGADALSARLPAGLAAAGVEPRRCGRS